MGPVVEARTVDSSTFRETASEREENKEGSLEILRKVRQGAEAWNQQREKINQASANLTKRTSGQAKVRIGASIKMTGSGFTNRT